MVSLISPALDPGSTTVEVWVKLKNPDGQLKAGTPVHVAIVGRTVPDALQVPASALLTNDDGSLGVMVVGGDSTAHMKTVTVGIRLPDTVQILSGISPKRCRDRHRRLRAAGRHQGEDWRGRRRQSSRRGQD